MHAQRPRPSVVIGLALLGLLLAPFATAVAASGYAQTKILHVWQGAYPSTLDPQRGGFINEIAVYTLGYEGLTRLDATLTTVPAAAEHWSFDATGTVLTFRLRDGLTYSDGSSLTAQRFVDAAIRTCDPRTAAQYAPILFVVAGCRALFDLGATVDAATLAEATDAVGITAPDDRTVEVQLTQPAPSFPTVAATWVFFPAKRELIAAGGTEWWTDGANHVGNGPLTITAVKDHDRISFRANPHYWAGRPKLDGIDYIYGEDGAAALAAYKLGRIDIVGVGGAELAAVNADPLLRTQLLTYPQAFTNTFQFNLTKEPFTDKNVREAFAYAFDRETWCTVILAGACNPTLSWIPEGVPGHVPTNAYAFDPVKARAALAASSYETGARLPPIEVIIVGDPTTDPSAEWTWVVDQYRTILGVELTLVVVDFPTWVGLTGSAETYPMINTLGGWGQDYPDPQNWLSIVYACDSTYAPQFGYCNPAFDEVVHRADQELDPPTRLALYEEATQVLIADAAFVVVSNTRATVLVNPRVTGLVPTPSDFGFPGQYASLLTADLAA